MDRFGKRGFFSLLFSYLVLGLFGCSNSVSGPQPIIEAPDEVGELQPGFVCAEQVDDWVTVRGDGFSPLMEDVLGYGERGTGVVVLPEIILRRSLTFDGVPCEMDFEVTLVATEEEDEPNHVRWISPSEMRFRVTPDLELEPGIYNVTVSNANGQSVTVDEKFGVLPRPLVTDVSPVLTCLEDDDKEIIIYGENFLYLSDDSTPTVTVGNGLYTPVAKDNCRPLGEVFDGSQVCGQLTVVIEQNDLSAGLGAISVHNPGHSTGCGSLSEEDNVDLLVVTSPQIHAIEEELGCVVEGERSFTVFGEDFLESAGLRPTVTVGENTYSVSSIDACDTQIVRGEEFKFCSQVSFTIPQGGLPAGVHDVVVTNPPPSDCRSTEPLQLTLFAKPVVDSVIPELICSRQLENTLVITGEGFIVVGDQAPTVSINEVSYDSVPSQCVPVESVLHSTVQLCTELTMVLGAGMLGNGVFPVTVSNPLPAGCSSLDNVALVTVPPPLVTDVVEPITCTNDRLATLSVMGTGFLNYHEATPVVTIGGEEVVVTTMDQCADVLGTQGVQSCNLMIVEVEEALLEPGFHSLQVTNPAPAACVSPDDSPGAQVYFAPSPIANAIVEELACLDAGTRHFVLSGAEIMVIDDQLPTVNVGPISVPARTVEDCEVLDIRNKEVAVCTSLTFDLGQGTIQAGHHLVTITNPQPAQCSSVDGVDLTLVPAPDVQSLAPLVVCTEQVGHTMVMDGDHFYLIGEQTPEVSIGDIQYPVTIDGCTVVDTVHRTSVQRCTQMTFDVPPGDLLPGENLVEVTNPMPAGCSASHIPPIIGLPPPVVTGADPPITCLDTRQANLRVTGTGFLRVGVSLPEVFFGDVSVQVIDTEDCIDVNGAPEVESCNALGVRVDQQAIEAGEHAIRVVNPAPAPCESDPEPVVLIHAMPAPTVTGIVENLACIMEGEHSFTVEGEDFLVVDGVMPIIQVGPNRYDAEDALDCVNMGLETLSVEICSSLTFTLPEQDLVNTAHSVRVTNPPPAECQSSNPVSLWLVPKPEPMSIFPPLTCNEQEPSQVTIGGSNFFRVHGEAPQVLVGDLVFQSEGVSCAPAPGINDPDVERCQQIRVTFEVGDLEAGASAFRVRNPAPVGCTSEGEISMRIIEAPEVVEVVAPVVCVETSSVTLSIFGNGFLQTSNASPRVLVADKLATLLSMEDCTPIDGVASMELCTELVVELSQGWAASGDHLVSVINPTPAACSSEETVYVHFVGAPTVSSVDPPFFCPDDEGDMAMTVHGEGFITRGADLPEVHVAGVIFPAEVVDNCEAGTGLLSEYSVCTRIQLTIPSGTLPSGHHEVSVVNPHPLQCGSCSTGNIMAGGPPNISGVDPPAACSGAAFNGELTLVGDTFLGVGDVSPTVLINGIDVGDTTLRNCQDLGLHNARTCTALSVNVPVELHSDDLIIVVTNPPPNDCGGQAQIDYQFERTPVIESVVPMRICNLGGTLLVTGEDFQQGMTATLGGQSAQEVAVAPDGLSAELTFVTTFNTGSNSLMVRNPNNCMARFDDPINVVAGPKPIFVDPPAAYNGITTLSTVYLSGLQGGSVTGVNVIDSDGLVTSLEFITDIDYPNKVQVYIPQGILPEDKEADVYTVQILDDVNCVGQEQNLLAVTKRLTIALEGIDPSFGWALSPTAVTVSAVEPPPEGQVQFRMAPRVYLNPSEAGPDSVAREMRSMQFLSEIELNGIIEAGPETGLTVGYYDLIVVNPIEVEEGEGGAVGVLDPMTVEVGYLPQAFRITQDPPPLIDAVSPGSWQTNNAALPFEVVGEHFRQPDEGGEVPFVQAECRSGGITTFYPVNVVSWNSELISATINTNNLDQMSVCVIIVTNDDGSYAEFSPVTVTNPAGKFVDFVYGANNMLTPRRGHASFSGRPYRAANFIYAVGGDNGDPVNGYVSGEASMLNRFGDPGPWFPLPYDLPEGRTLAQAVRIRDFVYLVGGHDGQGPSTDVLRAWVMDPLHTPRITSLDFDGEATHSLLTRGVYYYRVSAVMGPDDPYNPGGEGLAGEPRVVRVPASHMRVILSWTPIDGAVAYNIYRSPQANTPYGQEALLATVGQTHFTDNGTMGASDVHPMLLGSLGVWHKVADLAIARHSHGVTFAPNPVVENRFHIYAVAGVGQSEAALNTYEYLTVDMEGPRHQNVFEVNPYNDGGVWSLTTFARARFETVAAAATAANASRVGDDAWIYLMGGAVNSTAIDAALVDPDGALGPWISIDTNMQNYQAGFAGAIANNNLVVAGGHGRSPSDRAGKAVIDEDDVPQLTNRNSLSNVNMRPRYLMGYLAFNGFFYLTGGVGADNLVTNTMDYSILGGNP